MSGEKCKQCGADRTVIEAGNWGDLYACGSYSRGGPQSPDCQLRQLKQRVAALESENAGLRAKVADAKSQKIQEVPGWIDAKDGLGPWPVGFISPDVVKAWADKLPWESTVERLVAKDLFRIVDRLFGMTGERNGYKAALSRIAAAFSPVLDWYNQDGERTDLAEMLTEAVADLQEDRKSTLAMGRIRDALGLADGASVEDLVAEALRVIESLPVTADKVRWRPGLELWMPDRGEITTPEGEPVAFSEPSRDVHVTEMFEDEPVALEAVFDCQPSLCGEYDCGYECVVVKDCYSSRATAEAARVETENQATNEEI